MQLIQNQMKDDNSNLEGCGTNAIDPDILQQLFSIDNEEEECSESSDEDDDDDEEYDHEDEDDMDEDMEEEDEEEMENDDDIASFDLPKNINDADLADDAKKQLDENGKELFFGNQKGI